MTSRCTLIVSALLAAGIGALLAGSPASADEKKATGPRMFETPEAAAKAVIEAAEKNSDEMLKALVGPDERDLIQSGGDPVAAKHRADFVAKSKERMKLQDNKDKSKTIVVGHNRWPLPIPIVRGDKGWYLDAKAGREEILNRRIGDNELAAIKLCRLYGRAQIEYASKDRDGDDVREYAQRLRSSAGKQDGLYWDAAEGEELSPFGPLVEAAGPYMKKREKGDPFGGYIWQILCAQDENAPGGRHSYIINGNMIAGFGLIGYPATYGNSGIMTFIVSHHGEVLQKDLGKNTHERVKALFGFDPDSSWTVVEGE